MRAIPAPFRDGPIGWSAMLAAVLIGIVPAAGPITQSAGEPWPFGKGSRFSRGRDLWNLGI